MRSIFFLLIAICIVHNSVNGYKILEISLLPSRSHHNLNIGIADTLAKAGHEVTIISPFHRKESPCREISVPKIVDYVEKTGILGFYMSKKSTWEMMTLMVNLQRDMAEILFDNEGVKSLFTNETEKFDLIIYEYFSSDFLFGLSIKYDCPIILLTPVGMVDALAKLIGNPVSIATVPNMILGRPPGLNLWDRTKNLFLHLMTELAEATLMAPCQTRLYEKYFPIESKIESFEEVKNRVALVFSNTHPSIGVARPLLPNVIEIGGYHITDDPKPLDEDLQKIMDSSENGVIYFSMGSIVKGNEMDLKMKDALIKSFSKLNYTILWKFEEEVTGKSDNVVIRKWMPQNSILNHPNLKLFMTHGGLLSCTEAVHFGVPLIVIPVFADQPYNARMVEHRGQGLMLEMENITEASLDWAINEMLDNKQYAENARQIQDLYYDRPMIPLQAITYYSEHVIRTKGAKHLTTQKLCKFSLLLLDVIALILAVLGISVYLSVVCFKRIRVCYKKAKLSSTKAKANAKNSKMKLKRG